MATASSSSLKVRRESTGPKTCGGAGSIRRLPGAWMMMMMITMRMLTMTRMMVDSDSLVACFTEEAYSSRFADLLLPDLRVRADLEDGRLDEVALEPDKGVRC